MSVVVVQPNELPFMAQEIVASGRALAERRVRKLMVAVGLRFAHDAPRRTGRARSSVQPWVGDWRGAVEPEPKQAFYPLVGADAFDAAYANWRLGVPAGCVMAIPYGRRLAAGWSPQQPDGWVPALVMDEGAKAREAA